jgi:hypothetical protein
MLIEHWHFDTTTYDQDGEDSTWTIKVKHSSTVYQDTSITTTHNPNSEAFGQLMSTISKLTDKNMVRHDVMGNKRINGASSREDGPFSAGSEMGAVSTLSNKDISEETELHNDDPLYKATEERRNETPDEIDKRNEKHKLTKAEEERTIMDRYTPSRSVVHDILQHENHRKGYRFYYGVSSLT